MSNFWGAVQMSRGFFRSFLTASTTGAHSTARPGRLIRQSHALRFSPLLHLLVMLVSKLFTFGFGFHAAQLILMIQPLLTRHHLQATQVRIERDFRMSDGTQTSTIVRVC